MRTPTCLLSILALCCTTCKRSDTPQSIIAQEFRLPIVLQENEFDTLKYFEAGELSANTFRYYGKFKFTDSIQFSAFSRNTENYVDDYVKAYDVPKENDSLRSDGFQIIVDYKTTLFFYSFNHGVGYSYFPVYVINETSQSKRFIGKDRKAFGIQEAVDTTGGYSSAWYPIEIRPYDFCGNGFFGLIVHPNEFIMLLIPKYKGNTTGLMRLRLSIDDNVYVSAPYTGSFNDTQFIVKKNSWVDYTIQDLTESYIQTFFYGATPKKYEPYN